MSQNPPTPPPTDEPTPEEEKKFLKVIDKFLANDDTPAPTQQAPASAPQQSGGNVVGEVLRALEFRDSEKAEKARIAGIENENKTLKAAAAAVVPKKKRPWFSFLAGD